MRQRHKAGEKCFVDYTGQTVPIACADTGEIKPAQVFVAVLGASNYTFAQATLTQSLPDWLASHVRAFEYFGGSTTMVVPDNLKSGVIRACRYDPDLNPSYQQWAEYYQTAVVPARPYKPKDKSKAEVGVQIVERWILAPLRHHTFFSLAELNQCIRALLEELNEKPFKQLPGNRKAAFEMLDKPALKPLPRQLKLGGMANALQGQLEQVGTYEGLAFTERLALLVEQETLTREQRKQERLIR